MLFFANWNKAISCLSYWRQQLVETLFNALGKLFSWIGYEPRICLVNHFSRWWIRLFLFEYFAPKVAINSIEKYLKEVKPFRYLSLCLIESRIEAGEEWLDKNVEPLLYIFNCICEVCWCEIEAWLWLWDSLLVKIQSDCLSIKFHQHIFNIFFGEFNVLLELYLLKSLLCFFDTWVEFSPEVHNLWKDVVVLLNFHLCL